MLGALGATLGSALDSIHTHSGVTAYTHPVVLRMAWWVPLLFGGAFALGLVRPLVDKSPHRPSWSRIVGAWALFVSGYVLSGVPLDAPLLAAALAGMYLVSFWFLDRNIPGVAMAVGAAIGGPLFESALVSAGVFVHTKPDYLGVSGWLPCLYLLSSPALGLTAKRLVMDRLARVARARPAEQRPLAYK